MEEKKPLESCTLTHTSKEPEAQVWANIGTANYATPTKKDKDSVADATVVSTGVQEEVMDPSEPANQVETSNQVVSSQVNNDEEGSALELHVDSNAEPIQREGSAESESGGDSKKACTLEEKREKNKLGDGFEGVEEAEQGPSKARGRTRLGDRTRPGDRTASRERSRSHDRSTSRGRDGRTRPTRESTSSTDVKKIKSRVFVGHLSSPDCDPEVLREAFSKYGKVTGINLQHGYGFVQFDNQESALESIKGLNQTKLFGETIGKNLRK